MHETMAITSPALQECRMTPGRSTAVKDQATQLMSSSLRDPLGMGKLSQCLCSGREWWVCPPVSAVTTPSRTPCLLRLMIASNWHCCFVNLAHMACHKLELPFRCRNQEINNRNTWCAGDSGTVEQLEASMRPELVLATSANCHWREAWMISKIQCAAAPGGWV